MATTADIKALGKDAIEGAARSAKAKGDFLKCLVATTQNKLGFPIPSRSVHRPKLTETERQEQLMALREVYAEFYAVLVETASSPGKKKEDVLSEVNFAATSKSELTTWLKAGHDLRTLVPAKVSKGSLRKEKKARRVSVADRVVSLAASLAEEAVKLSNSDKDKARDAVQRAMAQLAAIMDDIGIRTTKDVETAVREGRPVNIEGNKMFPLAALVPATATANRVAA
ncbi:MAG TPA: hypothetical protein VFA39_15840 [Steroidobacteraceae bacterium]|nr:hypothetical protein [Steroidobacteraceae bacterium]